MGVVLILAVMVSSNAIEEGLGQVEAKHGGIIYTYIIITKYKENGNWLLKIHFFCSPCCASSFEFTFFQLSQFILFFILFYWLFILLAVKLICIFIKISLDSCNKVIKCGYTARCVNGRCICKWSFWKTGLYFQVRRKLTRIKSSAVSGAMKESIFPTRSSSFILYDFDVTKMQEKNKGNIPLKNSTFNLCKKLF